MSKQSLFDRAAAGLARTSPHFDLRKLPFSVALKRTFAQGYNTVIWGNNTTPQKVGTTNSKGYTLVGDQIAPGWANDKGGAIFQQQFTAHPNINATVEANDGLGNAVIQVLKNAGVQPKKIPATGQDATQQGMINVLQGYQCGSVYKPIYLEARPRSPSPPSSGPARRRRRRC